MSETPKHRWSTWEPVAPSLTTEQAQRVHALRAAREVCEFKNTAPAFTVPSLSVETAELLVVAQWICDGERVPAVAFEADLDRWLTTRQRGSDD